MHTLEVPVPAEPLDQLDGLRRVDGEEDTGLRRRGDAVHHGRGHVLLDAADGVRDSRLGPDPVVWTSDAAPARCAARSSRVMMPSGP